MRPNFTLTAGLTLLAGFMVLFVGGGSRFAIGLTFKPIVDHFNWDRSDLGLSVAAFQVVSSIAMFLAGLAADRIGPRPILIAGTLIGAVGIGFMATIAAPWHALILYGFVFAIGNGAASLIPVGVMVTRAFPNHTGIASSVAVSGMSLGQLLMIGSLAAVLVTSSWQMSLSCWALLTCWLYPFFSGRYRRRKMVHPHRVLPPV